MVSNNGSDNASTSVRNPETGTGKTGSNQKGDELVKNTTEVKTNTAGVNIEETKLDNQPTVVVNTGKYNIYNKPTALVNTENHPAVEISMEKHMKKNGEQNHIRLRLRNPRD